MTMRPRSGPASVTVTRTSVGRSAALERIAVVEIAAIAVVDEIVGAHGQPAAAS